MALATFCSTLYRDEVVFVPIRGCWILRGALVIRPLRCQLRARAPGDTEARSHWHDRARPTYARPNTSWVAVAPRGRHLRAETCGHARSGSTCGRLGWTWTERVEGGRARRMLQARNAMSTYGWLAVAGKNARTSSVFTCGMRRAARPLVRGLRHVPFWISAHWR